MIGDRAPRALRLLELLANALDGRVATVGWLRMSQTLAEAQLTTGHIAAASQTASDLLQMLEQAHGTQGRAYRAAMTTAALAAIRAGDAATGAALLARIAQKAMPPFASAAERADCELRQAQALPESGSTEQAAGIAHGLLGDLSTQHPQSPRLALARQLAGLGR